MPVFETEDIGLSVTTYIVPKNETQKNSMSFGEGLRLAPIAKYIKLILN